MTTQETTELRHYWTVTLAAAAILMITMGARQSQGLFVSPVNTATGLGIATISFAMAVGQFMWGAIQPVAGAISDRYGPGRVLVWGLFALAAGSALTPHMSSGFGLVVSLGLLTAMGSGAGSFSVLIGATASQLPMERRGMASGIINAGGSFGQFVFAPLLQRLISALGWVGAMYALAVITLAGLPLVRKLTGSTTGTPRPAAASNSDMAGLPADRGLKAAVVDAMADRSYLLLHAGFFTCGFHIAFLVTHLPGEVALCGLPANVASWSLALIGLANIAGSLNAGWCVSRYRSKHILFWMYASRALLVLLYLMAPKNTLTFYLFAIGLGFTWLATVPPTAALVGKLFGHRYLATLFGLTLLSHQIGGFFGAWLGGIVVVQSGAYDYMWYADMALAAAAALVNLPIREAPVLPRAATA